MKSQEMVEDQMNREKKMSKLKRFNVFFELDQTENSVTDSIDRTDLHLYGKLWLKFNFQV